MFRVNSTSRASGGSGTTIMANTARSTIGTAAPCCTSWRVRSKGVITAAIGSRAERGVALPVQDLCRHADGLAEGP